MASSPSVSSQGSQKYDVFLNFRGDDVRHNFLSHLILAFDHASLNIFVDYKLKRGEHIKSALMDAIQDSKVSLTIFSEGYASSKWCLDELVKTMDCRKNPTLKQKVIPVFYHVTPSDVRNVQRGVFAQDFAKHESDHRSRSKVPRWKAAMEAAGDLSGRIVSETSSEAHVVNQIVDDVLTNLGRNYPISNPGDEMLFHASIHYEIHVFLHNLNEIPSKELKEYSNIQQPQRNGSISTISREQGLPVQEDLIEFFVSIRSQVEVKPSESGGDPLFPFSWPYYGPLPSEPSIQVPLALEWITQMGGSQNRARGRETGDPWPFRPEWMAQIGGGQDRARGWGTEDPWPSESHLGQRLETSNSYPSWPISYHYGGDPYGLGSTIVPTNPVTQEGLPMSSSTFACGGGNNTNGYGLGGTTVPYSSMSMSNGNCLDLGNGNRRYGYPMDYGNGQLGYLVDLGNGTWSYYAVREDGNLYPYELDDDEQAGQGPVKKRQKLKSFLKALFYNSEF